MSRFNLTAAAAAAALVLGFSAPVLASDFYPRAIGGGEDTTIEYGPGAPQNVVGGGQLQIRQLGNGETDVSYFDDSVLQRPRVGERPVQFGSGEGAEIVWVPVEGPLGVAPLAALGIRR